MNGHTLARFLIITGLRNLPNGEGWSFSIADAEVDSGYSIRIGAFQTHYANTENLLLGFYYRQWCNGKLITADAHFDRAFRRTYTLGDLSTLMPNFKQDDAILQFWIDNLPEGCDMTYRSDELVNTLLLTKGIGRRFTPISSSDYVAKMGKLSVIWGEYKGWEEFLKFYKGHRQVDLKKYAGYFTRQGKRQPAFLKDIFYAVYMQNK